MREIRFRAWHKEKKVMFSAEEMGVDQMTLMTDGRGFVNVSSVNSLLSQIDNGRKMIPLQYTGLKDSKGVEIYEGDIVKPRSKFVNVNFEVYWDDRVQQFRLCSFGDTQYDKTHDMAWSDEVVGNIFQS